MAEPKYQKLVNLSEADKANLAVILVAWPNVEDETKAIRFALDRTADDARRLIEAGRAPLPMRDPMGASNGDGGNDVRGES